MESKNRLKKRIRVWWIELLKLAVVLLIVFFVSFYFRIRSTFSRWYPDPQKQSVHESNYRYFKEAYHPEDVQITTQDGLTLAGLLFNRSTAQRAILLVHGYHMTKEQMREFIDFFPQDIILAIDLRGHGQSEGDVISLGYHEQKDVLAAVQYLKTNSTTKDLPLYGLGTSMGSVALLCAAAQTDAFKGIIIDSPFADFKDQFVRSYKARTTLPDMPFLWLARLFYYWTTDARITDISPISCAEHIKTPVLIVHARNDSVTPFEDSERLYHALKGKKELFSVANAPHSEIFKNYWQQYQQRIQQFMQDTYVSKP
ncbi:MAG: alpha/beta fold hydrolase [Candidatus Babeliales bacterium]